MFVHNTDPRTALPVAGAGASGARGHDNLRPRAQAAAALVNAVADGVVTSAAATKRDRVAVEARAVAGGMTARAQPFKMQAPVVASPVRGRPEDRTVAAALKSTATHQFRKLLGSPISTKKIDWASPRFDALFKSPGTPASPSTPTVTRSRSRKKKTRKGEGCSGCSTRAANSACTRHVLLPRARVHGRAHRRAKPYKSKAVFRSAAKGENASRWLVRRRQRAAV